MNTATNTVSYGLWVTVLFAILSWLRCLVSCVDFLVVSQCVAQENRNLVINDYILCAS